MCYWGYIQDWRACSSSCPPLASSQGEPSSNDPFYTRLYLLTQFATILKDHPGSELPGAGSNFHWESAWPSFSLFFPPFFHRSWPQRNPLISLLYANLHLRVCCLESPTCDRRDVNIFVHSAIRSAFLQGLFWDQEPFQIRYWNAQILSIQKVRLIFLSNASSLLLTFDRNIRLSGVPIFSLPPSSHLWYHVTLTCDLSFPLLLG